MSHYEKIEMEDLKFSSLSALKAAAEALERPLQHNGICRGYNNQQKQCDYVIPLLGEYDIGFDLQPDRNYAMVADFFSNHISKYLSTPEIEAQGEKLARSYMEQGEYEKADLIRKIGKVGKFIETYQLKMIEEEALLSGYSYKEERLEDGTIDAILEK